MQSLFLLNIAIFFLNSVNAQDTIHIKSETTVLKVKIMEVNLTNLKYKKFSSPDGPIYTIEKKKIDKVVYQNGDIEVYSDDNSNKEIKKNSNKQASLELIPSSKLFLSFVFTENEENVDGDDAKNMLKDYIKDKTKCVIVNSTDEADFIIELRVVKKSGSTRSAKILITNILTNKVVCESTWIDGKFTAYFNYTGYSGSKAAIEKVAKSYILEKYPAIKI